MKLLNPVKFVIFCLSLLYTTLAFAASGTPSLVFSQMLDSNALDKTASICTSKPVSSFDVYKGHLQGEQNAMNYRSNCVCCTSRGCECVSMSYCRNMGGSCEGGC